MNNINYANDIILCVCVMTKYLLLKSKVRILKYWFLLYSTSHGDCALGRVLLADLGALGGSTTVTSYREFLVSDSACAGA